MRKRILSIIVVALLLLFTGCDAVLNSVYPSYDPDNEDYESANNSIYVNLMVDNNINVYGDEIKLALVPMYDGVMDFESIWIIDFWGEVSIDHYFNGLRNSAYRLFAFQDQNGDNNPNWNEPSTELTSYFNGRQPGLFDFRYNDDDLEINATGHLGTFAGIGSVWLEEFNTDQTDQGDYFDSNFFISGTDVITTNTTGPVFFSVIKNDPSTNYVDSEIKMYKNGIQIFFDQFGYSPDYNQYSNLIEVEFDSLNVSFNSGDTFQIELILDVEKNSVNRSATSSFFGSFNSLDLGFGYTGPTSLYKNYDFDLEKTFYINPNDITKVVSSVEWRITDSWGNDVKYDSFSTFNYVNYEQLGKIDIDLGLLDPRLDAEWWSDPFLIFKVKVFYDDDTSSVREFNIDLN